MRGLRSGLAALFVLGLMLAGRPGASVAAEFPSGPITIIVPWTAGGITDSVARVLAEEMRQALGQPVIVENRPGAGGRIGSLAVSRAPADGHTIVLATTSSHVLAPLSKTPPYDVLNAFDPLILLNTTAGALVASKTFAPNSLAELIAYAKANPGKVNCATIGVGSTSHLSCEMLRSLANIDIVHVPYKGEASVLNDLFAGQVQIYFLIAARPYVTGGQVKLIGANSKERTLVNPDWPTLHELGLTGFDRSGWQGFMLPRGTPKAVVEKLNAVINEALQKPHVRKRIIDLGLNPQGGPPEAVTQRIKQELTEIGAMLKALNIELN